MNQRATATAPTTEQPSHAAPTRESSTPVHILEAAHGRAHSSTHSPADRFPFTGNQSRLRHLTLQRKLAVGSVNDPLEAEADHIADRVMRTPAPASPAPPPVSPGASGVMRRCSCGGTCSACQEDAELRRKATGSPTLTEAPPIVHETLSSPGRPLDPATRAFMEPRFGRDFSAVRIHTDPQAAESARQVNSLAYTVGTSIVFRSGSYDAQSESGRRLLAHELTHVVQQSPHAGGLNGIHAGQPAAIRRAPPRGRDDDPPKPAPVRPAERVDYGSTPLSKEAIRIRRASPGMSGDRNLVVVRYTWRSTDSNDPPHPVIEGIWNSSSIAHSEEELDQRFRDIKKERGGKVEITVTGIFSERQFCGPSSHNCLQLIYKSYPNAEKEFAYNYQTPHGARSGGGANTRNVVRQRIETFRDSGNEVDTSTHRDPPPHDETSGGRLPGQVRRPPTPPTTTHGQDTDTPAPAATNTPPAATNTPAPTNTPPPAQTPPQAKPADDPATQTKPASKTTQTTPTTTQTKTADDPATQTKPASKPVSKPPSKPAPPTTTQTPAQTKPAADPATQTKPAPKPAPKPPASKAGSKPAPPTPKTTPAKPAAKAAPAKPAAKPTTPAKSTPTVDPPSHGGLTAKDSATISAGKKIAGNVLNRFNSSIKQIVRENNHDPDLATGLDLLDKAVDVHSFLENPKTFTAQAIKTAAIQGVFDHFSGKLDDYQKEYVARFPEVSLFHQDPLGTGITLEQYEKLYLDAQANLRLPNAHKALLYVYFLLGTNEKTPEAEVRRRIALANDALATLPDLAVYANQYAIARQNYEDAIRAVTRSMDEAIADLVSQPAGFSDDLLRRGDALTRSGDSLVDLGDKLMANPLAILFEEVYAAGSELQGYGQNFDRLGAQFNEFADLVAKRRSVYEKELKQLQTRRDKIDSDRSISLL